MILCGRAQTASAEGFLDFLFAQPQAPAQPQEGGGSVMLQQQSRHRHRSVHEDSGVSFDYSRRPRRPASGDAGKDKEGGGTAMGHRSICVRLCDGYPFPIGHYGGGGDRAAQEATCRSECPGAATALFLMPGESDSIGDAVGIASDQKYSKLPAAFKYQTTLTPACTCHPQGGSPVRSLLRDFTLRRGDVVMTPSGFKVFHGDARFPFRQADFVPLPKSSDIHRPVFALLAAMERTSLRAASKTATTRHASFEPDDHVLTVHH